MNVVIVGANAAGLKVASRLRRLKPDASIVVIEQRTTFSYSACGMPYFLSGEINTFSELNETPWGEAKDEAFFSETRNIRILTGHRAGCIDRMGKSLTVRNIESGGEESLEYDYLVLAMGGHPVIPEFSGCDLPEVTTFTIPEEAISLREALEANEIGRVAIVGAGYAGLELCEAFGDMWGVDVVLIEEQPRVMPKMLDREMALIVENHLESKGIALRLDSRLRHVRRTESGLVAVLEGGAEESVDRVVIAAGSKPNIELAVSTGLDIGPEGGVLVDESGRTSDPNIFAVGDCAEFDGVCAICRLPLGSIAQRMGRIVAGTIAGNDDAMPPLFGSTIVKVFDLNVGACGISARMMESRGRRAESYGGAFPDHVHFYPEAKNVRFKLVREMDGKLVGLQVISEGEVVRWINAFAQILDLAGGDPTALNRLDHAYAPPYATPLDPLHYLAAMVETGPDLQVPPDSLLDGGEGSWTIVNMLNEAEREKIELPKVRGRVFEMDLRGLRRDAGELPETGVVTLCAKGSRSYEAALWLRSRGIEARYLAGGVSFYM